MVRSWATSCLARLPRVETPECCGGQLVVSVDVAFLACKITKIDLEGSDSSVNYDLYLFQRGACSYATVELMVGENAVYECIHDIATYAVNAIRLIESLLGTLVPHLVGGSSVNSFGNFQRHRSALMYIYI